MFREDNLNSTSMRLVTLFVILMFAITWSACGTSSQSTPTTTPTTPSGTGTGSGGTGATGGGPSTAAFGFVYNSVGHTVTTFTVNSDGSLTATGNSPIAVINASGFGIAVAAGDVWLSTSLPSQLASYQINADGSLKQLNVIQTPSSGRLHAVGNFLYEPASSGQLLGYAVTSSGTASAVPGSPYGNLSNPILDVASTADGKMLYAIVGTSTGDILQAYLINPDGSLTAQGSVPVGAPADMSPGRGPHDTVLAVAGSFVITASPSDGSVRSFLTGSGGSLTPVGTASVGGDVPETIATSGSYAYVATSGRNVYSFSVGSTGSLTKVSQADGGFAPSTMAVTHNGSLYVLYYDPGEITGFSTTNGNLAPLPGSPYSGPGMRGNNPIGIVFSQ